MSSAICFNLDQSKLLLSVNGLIQICSGRPPFYVNTIEHNLAKGGLNAQLGFGISYYGYIYKTPLKNTA